jgi:GT2 family glycosyltransferase
MKYIFIAVNFNGSFHCENFLKSIVALNKNSTSNISAFIVDNNSNEEDWSNLQKISANYKFTRLIRLDVNLGYFGGLNQAIKLVENNLNNILIVCNNDIVFDMDFIVNFEQLKLTPEVMAIAPNVTTLDGRMQNPHVVKSVSYISRIKSDVYYSNYYVGQIFRYLFRLLRKMLKEKPVILKNNYPQMVIKRGIGACYLLMPSFFNAYQHLDDRVFLWGEEALLSNQIDCAGGVTLYVPSLKVLHAESVSVKKIENKKRYDINKESYKIYRKYL